MQQNSIDRNTDFEEKNEDNQPHCLVMITNRSLIMIPV